MAAAAAHATSLEADEALALSLARQEQERADAEFAQRLAQEGSGRHRSGGGAGWQSSSASSSKRLLEMTCAVCEAHTQVAVPIAAGPGTHVRAACPTCTSLNDFVVPAANSQLAQQSRRHGAPQHAQRNLDGGALPRARREEKESPYVACEIADRAVEMLVDTGASTSVISKSLVDTLGLQSKLDARYQGMAAGIGTARIVGSLRDVQVKLGHVEFFLDFTVLGTSEPLLILGIDQMRRFRCIVDMERGVLVFGGRDGVEVSFLPSSTHRADVRNSACPQM
mmetsp:Transcript_62729/g.149658  ORF Transcript_62729/g.149658 Transcript_62729/m.149658 type:complete len:281 (-) Transcript_62729:113-955(-)